MNLLGLADPTDRRVKGLADVSDIRRLVLIGFEVEPPVHDICKWDGSSQGRLTQPSLASALTNTMQASEAPLTYGSWL
jgi:hypothetical protein